MKRMSIIVAVAVAIALGAVWFFARSPERAPQETGAGATGAAFLNLAFTDYAGMPVALRDFSGKPLIINAWAAWCPFCRKELPDFAVVQEEFGDRVQFIAIDRAEPLETAQRYTDELKVTDELVLLLDPSDSFYTAIGGFSMPETIFVRPDGVVQFHKRGPMEVAEIRERVELLLAAQ